MNASDGEALKAKAREFVVQGWLHTLSPFEVEAWAEQSMMEEELPTEGAYELCLARNMSLPDLVAKLVQLGGEPTELDVCRGLMSIDRYFPDDRDVRHRCEEAARLLYGYFLVDAPDYVPDDLLSALWETVDCVDFFDYPQPLVGAALDDHVEDAKALLRRLGAAARLGFQGGAPGVGGDGATCLS